MINVLTVFGTRPEAIKMCPLVLELQAAAGINSTLCVTGQHRSMLDQVLEIFKVQPDYDLAIMKPSQSLNSITTDVLLGMGEVIAEVKPQVVLVHGDTTTSMASALAAFYQQVPVGQVEAGLRTYNIYSPVPEEMNRRLITALSTYYFAPTQGNARALEKEGVTKNVFVTGNTVIDSFKYTIQAGYQFKDAALAAHDFSQPTVLMTAHRRENLGQPLQHLCAAVLELCRKFPQLRFIYPVHLNPAVYEPVHAALGSCEQITLTQPIDVQDMHNAMGRSHFILTDSGGLQEEAPHLGKPVLVLRTETERPEAVEAGTVVVAGVETADIVSLASRLMEDEAFYQQMSKAHNPYGDGHASERIVQALLDEFAGATV
jgi:UDP-N-acetylglucosamine 2-epimerase (non-hydrolysing)